MCRPRNIIWGMTDKTSDGPTNSAGIVSDSIDCICVLRGNLNGLALRTVRYSPEKLTHFDARVPQ